MGGLLASLQLAFSILTLAVVHVEATLPVKQAFWYDNIKVRYWQNENEPCRVNGLHPAVGTCGGARPSSNVLSGFQ
jgi:hypothetical protein